ncbi:MAG: ScpA family protein [Actinomycetota bacterium]
MIVFENQVILKEYEDPTELLLDLINSQEVDVYYVSISEITNKYIQSLRFIKDIDIEKASHFILTASILLELKSLSLLPQEEKEETFEDTQEMLERKLREYRKYKKISKFLENIWENESRTYPSCVKLEEVLDAITSEFIGEIDINDLVRTWNEFSTAQIETEKVNTSFIRKIRINIEEEISRILDVLKKSPKTSFREITSHFKDKIKIIVSFLAILELYKSGEIDLLQRETFGTIEIFRKDYLS